MFDVLIAIGAVAGVFWLGFFTASALHLAKAADEAAEETYEHWRGER